MSFIYVYFFTELKIYLLSYFYLQTLPYRHCWIPSSMQDTCHMNFVIDLAHHGVSVAQWLGIGAQNLKGLRFDSSRGLRILSLSHACDKMKTSLFNVLFIVKFERFKDNWSVSLSPLIQLSSLHLWDFYGVHIKIWVQDLNQKCLNYMYSFLLFCKCIQTYVEFGLRVLHYGYITEILRTVPAALHLQSQWKDDVLVFK